MSTKIISVTFKSPMGFLKKTDMNEDMYLTYNSLHKPAVLGILGAICGLEGFYQGFIKDPKGLPGYYEKFRDLQIGIQQVTGGRSSVFKKAYLSYNNSTGAASDEEGGNLIITEQFLLNPQYKVFIKLDDTDELQRTLMHRLKENEAVYIPYLGKNEHHLWWEDFTEHHFVKYVPKPGSSYRIRSLFRRPVDQKIVRGGGLWAQLTQDAVFNFERLPSGYDPDLRVYTFDDYVTTNTEIDGSYDPGNLVLLDNDLIVQMN